MISRQYLVVVVDRWQSSVSFQQQLTLLSAQWEGGSVCRGTFLCLCVWGESRVWWLQSAGTCFLGSYNRTFKAHCQSVNRAISLTTKTHVCAFLTELRVTMSFFFFTPGKRMIYPQHAFKSRLHGCLFPRWQFIECKSGRFRGSGCRRAANMLASPRWESCFPYKPDVLEANSSFKCGTFSTDRGGNEHHGSSCHFKALVITVLHFFFPSASVWLLISYLEEILSKCCFFLRERQHAGKCIIYVLDVFSLLKISVTHFNWIWTPEKWNVQYITLSQIN